MAVKKILTDINVTGTGTFSGTATASPAILTSQLATLGQVNSAVAGKEDAFTHNTAFNKDFGTGNADVARGDHTHTPIDLSSYLMKSGGTMTGELFTLSHIRPDSNNVSELGSDTLRWKNTYCINGFFSGPVLGGNLITNAPANNEFVTKEWVTANGGGIGGSIADKQIAYGSGTSIAGSNNFTWDGTRLDIVTNTSESSIYVTNNLTLAAEGASMMSRLRNTGAKQLYIDLGAWRSSTYFGIDEEMPILRAHSNADGTYYMLVGRNTSSASIINSRLQVGYGINLPDLSDPYVLSVNGTGWFEGDVTGFKFYESSDERLKENIEKLDDTFVSFSFKKDEDSIKHYGAIAQELEIDFPELVKTGEDGFKSVDYTGLLVKELVEVKKKNKDLEDRLKRLEEIVFKKK